jgi:hypothetical protein
MTFGAEIELLAEIKEEEIVPWTCNSVVGNVVPIPTFPA